MKQITVLAGDGIGPEIMQSALSILEVAAKGSSFVYDLSEHAFGGAGIDASGHPLPEATLKACQESDAILLGAIGGPQYNTAKVRPEQGLLSLRKALGLYANIRPIKVLNSIAHLSPLKEEKVKNVDFVVVRELTGGIYFGEPRELHAENALDTNTYTKTEIERIVRHAFELARTRRKKVTSVDKENVLATSKLWRQVTTEIGKEYPDVALEHQLVDSCAMLLITNPEKFDVIVTENLFGDILSDEASVLPGSLGVMPSASHGLSGLSLYEPIHGSAPDIAGLNIANPISMIFSVSMMLRESFREFELAEKIDTAVERVMNKGILTKDLGGHATTTDFTQAVMEELKKTTH